MVYQLEISDDALDDLDQVYEADEDEGAAIDVLLEELENANDTFLQTLLDHGHVRDVTPAFNVSRFQEQYRQGRNLWRIKPLRSRASSYRVIYAYSVRRRRFVVLAIVHRNFGYAADHPITERIVAAYRELD